MCQSTRGNEDYRSEYESVNNVRLLTPPCLYPGALSSCFKWVKTAPGLVSIQPAAHLSAF